MRSGQFRNQKSLGPLEISLEMAHYVVCPQKKIISRIFKISGALIVIMLLMFSDLKAVPDALTAFLVYLTAAPDGLTAAHAALTAAFTNLRAPLTTLIAICAASTCSCFSCSCAL